MGAPAEPDSAAPDPIRSARADSDPETPVAQPIGVRVRAATSGDLDELVRLDDLAREHLGPHRGGPVYLLRTARPQPPQASFLEDLDHPDRHVVLGCLGESVVGYALASVAELRDGAHIAEVGEIFVEPAARDVGVGFRLMSDLVDWATSRSCIGIDAHALPGDRNTKNFFESFGLVARAITVHRDLRTP